jgi:hypothetical protein
MMTAITSPAMMIAKSLFTSVPENIDSDTIPTHPNIRGETFITSHT